MHAVGGNALALIAIDVHQIGLRQTGNETYTRNLVEEIAMISPAGLEFVCFTTQEQHNLPPVRWPGTIKRIRPHTALIRIPFSFPLELLRIKAHVAHFQYVAPLICPCPTVVTVHDISYEFFPDFFHPIDRKRMQVLIPFSMKKAALILTISEFSKQSIIDKYRLRPERIQVIYCGVSPAFRPLEGSSIARDGFERLGILPPFILGIGNLQPRKNLERLLRGYADLRKRRSPPHRLVLVGQSSWQGHRVGEEISRLGLTDWVSLPGYLADDDLVVLYNLADVFIYPSLFEGFGLPVIEAMACGTPVITSNVSSLPEVAGNAAILIDPQSETEISRALERVIDKAALRLRLRAAGLARSGLFSWRSTAEKTVEAYRSCL